MAPGSYVVHHQHGVGKYAGMVKRAIGGAERDYLLLEYKGDDKLYVPSDQIDAVRHYTGGEAPTLSRLGGDGWQKAKAKVRSAVCEIAHLGLVLSGRNRIEMTDGRVIEVGPGDLFEIGPGHDSVVIGDEPYVSIHFLGADQYAR